MLFELLIKWNKTISNSALVQKKIKIKIITNSIFKYFESFYESAKFNTNSQILAVSFTIVSTTALFFDFIFQVTKIKKNMQKLLPTDLMNILCSFSFIFGGSTIDVLTLFRLILDYYQLFWFVLIQASLSPLPLQRV